MAPGFPQTGAAAQARGHDPERSLREFLCILTGKHGADLERLIEEGTAEGIRTDLEESAGLDRSASKANQRAFNCNGALTDRHRQVLRLAGEGLNYTEIARVLNVSPDTVKDHLKVARRILGARNTVHAVRLGIRAGVIDP